MKYILSLILVLIIAFSCVQSPGAGKNMINIVALGDSITHGTGDATKKGYIERVHTGLENLYHIPVEIRNFAVPKYTTENILAQLKERKIKNKLRKADYIILYIGTNDFRKSADYQFQPLNTQGLNKGVRKYSINLHLILKNLRAENPSASIILLGIYHPYTEYKNEKEILSNIHTWNREMVKVMGEYTVTKYISTVDLFLHKPKKAFFSDSIHLNSAGYTLLADRILLNLVNIENKRQK